MRHVPHDLVLSGAVLTGNRTLRRLFLARLRRISPRSRPVTASARPIRGALMYAAHLAEWTLPPDALRGGKLEYGTMNST